VRANRLYDALAATPDAWPETRDREGRPLRLTPDAWGELSQSPDPAERRAANDLFFAHSGRLQSLLGELALARLETNARLARAQGYRDPIDAFFAIGDGLPEGSWRRLIEGARAHPELLRRLGRQLGGEAPSLGDLSAMPGFTYA